MCIVALSFTNTGSTFITPEFAYGAHPVMSPRLQPWPSSSLASFSCRLHSANLTHPGAQPSVMFQGESRLCSFTQHKT